MKKNLRMISHQIQNNKKRNEPKRDCVFTKQRCEMGNLLEIHNKRFEQVTEEWPNLMIGQLELPSLKTERKKNEEKISRTSETISIHRIEVPEKKRQRERGKKVLGEIMPKTS